jgi:protein SCO1/2
LASAPGVRLASLSFDRAHDTPAALGDYARRFAADPQRWVVATPANDDALRRVLAETGVVVIPDGMGGYAHNAAIHVIVPPGKLVRVFGMDQQHEALAFAAGLAR